MTTVQIRPEVIWCSNLCLQFEFYHTHVNFSLSSIPSKSQQVLLDYFYPNVLTWQESVLPADLTWALKRKSASRTSKTSGIQTHISEYYINRGTQQAPVMKKHIQKFSNVHGSNINATQEVSKEIVRSSISHWCRVINAIRSKKKKVLSDEVCCSVQKYILSSYHQVTASF